MTKFIFTIMFSCCLSFIVSAWVTYINIGMINHFLDKWAFAFINAWPASFTASYLLSPHVMRFAVFLTSTRFKRKTHK